MKNIKVSNKLTIGAYEHGHTKKKLYLCQCSVCSVCCARLDYGEVTL